MNAMLIDAPPSVQDTQRRHVQIALQPRQMARYLADVLEPDPARRDKATCFILDVKYEPGEYCNILYKFNEQLVIGTFRWAGATDNLPPSAQLIAPLNMQVYLFGQDPALPGLATVLDPRGLASILPRAVPELASADARILRCRVVPLRYRPGKRCTVRIDVVVRGSHGGSHRARTFFGKVYHDRAKAAAVYQEMQMLADSEPARAGQMIVARPAAFLAELQTVLQEPVEGVPLELLLSGFGGRVMAGDPRAWTGVVRAAPALAALHTAGLATERERPIEAEVRRFKQRAAKAATVDPVVGGRMIELANTLAVGLSQLPGWGEELSLVHGDCKPSQFLIRADGVAILDFDHCGMADPATDVGTFLATLRQQGLWQSLRAGGTLAALARTRWLRALEQQFLEDYCAASKRDDPFVLRATWYEAVALMRKALRSFARSPRSQMPRVLLDEAWTCLAALPSQNQDVVG